MKRTGEIFDLFLLTLTMIKLQSIRGGGEAGLVHSCASPCKRNGKRQGLYVTSGE